MTSKQRQTHREIIPADNYESLLRQFSALKSLNFYLEEQLTFYRNKDYTLSELRLKSLESQLESEKEMNAILTRELDDQTQKEDQE